MNAAPRWNAVLADAAARLAQAGVETPRRDARLLLAHALGSDTADVIARESDVVCDPVQTIFAAMIARRAAGEPVSRIRGWRDFYNRRFIISPAVLDPRPETELLVEEGLKRLPEKGQVLDLGTGSGCVLLSVLAERPKVAGLGVEISSAALETARANAAALNLGDRARFLEGDWSQAVGEFDLILSNPPYLRSAELAAVAREVREHDPKIALVAGEDGLEAYRAILRWAPARLLGGGSIGFEFGVGQEVALAALMERAGLVEIVVVRDLEDRPRAAFGRRPRED